MLLLPRWVLVSLSCVALVACGDDTSGTGGGAQGGGEVGAAGGNGAGAGGIGTGGNGTGGNGTGGNGVGGSGVGGASTICGGIAGDVCDPGYFCDYPNDDCGAGDSQGLCEPLPVTCTDEVLPTCACDGMVYGNPCEVNAAGFDRATSGCTSPPGVFACGSQFCGLADQACLQTPNDVPEPPDVFFSCGTLPPACAMQNVPNCACAAELATNCGGTCEISPEGGVVIHCPGG